ncbi:MAG: hypothetical protein J5850_02445, partial [Clostridia bacterium]|nr:hypothetical protein [Clostridia bacterium]
LDALCTEILSDETLNVLTLCGPSCSGKTILCDRLSYYISERGRNVVVVSLDNFFHNTKECDRSRTDLKDLDYDSPEHIDFETFRQFKEGFFAGKKVEIPVYDLGLGKRIGKKEIIPSGNDFVIFEGIQAFYPQFVSIMSDMKYKKAFVSVISGFEKDGVRFDPIEIRFIRRLVRDYYFRSSPPFFTYLLWKNVVRNENKNILPFAPCADYYFDSGIQYELPVLVDSLRSILSEMPESSEYGESAKELMEKVGVIKGIPLDFIPQTSICREFVR